MQSNSPTRSDLPPIPTLAQAEAICPACGRVLAQVSTAKGGRKRDYCSDACRVEFNQVLVGMQALYQLQLKATPQAWIELRRRVWSTCNTRAWNRGVHRRASEAADLAPTAQQE